MAYYRYRHSPWGNPSRAIVTLCGLSTVFTFGAGLVSVLGWIANDPTLWFHLTAMNTALFFICAVYWVNSPTLYSIHDPDNQATHVDTRGQRWHVTETDLWEVNDGA